jgi:hypothetical protein
LRHTRSGGEKIIKAVTTVNAKSSGLYWQRLFREVMQLMRLIFVLLTVLAFNLPVRAQTDSPVEALRQLDLKVIRVGVANAKPGEKSASSFMELQGGVTIDSILGCTITLRNEQTGKGRKWIYKVAIPLNELNSEGNIGQVAGGSLMSGENPGIDFPFWTTRFDVSSRRRFVSLHGPNSTLVAARGAHISFSAKERSTIDELSAALTKAIETCNKQ